MDKIKKYLWMTLGFICLGCAYIGVVTPGIPFSIFLVIAAFSFARSSKKMHDWLYSHKYFGPFLTNWGKYRVFPLYAKYTMVIMMSISLVIMWYSLQNFNAVLWTGLTMLGVSIWALRYPSTKEIHDQRIKDGKRVAWLK